MLASAHQASLASGLHRGSFAAATLLTAYLGWRIMKPKYPPQLAGKAGLRDTIASAQSFFLLAVCRNTLLAVGAWHALVSLARTPRQSPFLPDLGTGFDMDPATLRWNALTLTLYPLVWAASLLRLRAMGELGADFTFDLREPSGLNTGGMYRYVQHPSYSAGLVAFGGIVGWFMRADGVCGSLLPAWALRMKDLGNLAVGVVGMGVASGGIYLRVRDEEEMLHRKFGKEWEDWHMRTPRFVPFAPIWFRRVGVAAQHRTD